MSHTILVIDDDEQIRPLLTMVLETSGYTVFGAQDGREGLRLFYEHQPDLVITDLIMPEKEGIETIKELVDSSPGVKILLSPMQTT